MDRYVCQICNEIITFGDGHPCFLKMNYVFSIPQQYGVKNDIAKYEGKCNSSDNSEKICLEIQQTDVKASKKLNYLWPEKNEQVFFKRDIKIKRTFTSFPEETKVDAKKRTPGAALHFGTTLNVQKNEDRFREIPTFKTSSGNLEPGYESESRFCIQYKRKPSTLKGLFDQNKVEPRLSTSMQAAISEECEMYLGEKKFQSLTHSKNHSMDSLETVKKTPFHSKNIPEIPNLLVSRAFSNGGDGADQDSTKESGDLTHTTISSNVSSQTHGRSEEIPFNMKQPLDSFEGVSVVAGPSGLSTDLLRDEKRQIVCVICSRQFDRKSHFEVHYRTHTGDKPFQCKTCSKIFSRKDNLNTHLKTHTGEKPFVCDVCKKCFSVRSNLTVHTRIHTGQKPYKCSSCGMAFSTNANRNKHYQAKHK